VILTHSNNLSHSVTSAQTCRSDDGPTATHQLMTSNLTITPLSAILQELSPLQTMLMYFTALHIYQSTRHAHAINQEHPIVDT